MSLLRIFDESGAVISEAISTSVEITSKLENAGVLFEHWQADAPLASDADQEQVLAAYHRDVDRLMQKYGFQSVDVIALTPDHPDQEALRKKFLDEHTHSEFEVRFFVEGSGLFYIHHDDKVYAVKCCQGDLISVPADMPHWFDMGTAPSFKCIRLFTSPEGWVANYTGSDISGRLPDFTAFDAMGSAS